MESLLKRRVTADLYSNIIWEPRRFWGRVQTEAEEEPERSRLSLIVLIPQFLLWSVYSLGDFLSVYSSLDRSDLMIISR